jgi:glycosyltransferase involved in cell wall biosynthesis
MSRHVLFLAYLFPPIANSGTQRPLKFAKYLLRFGWKPIVITAADFDGQSVDEGLLADIPAAVRVVRVPMLNDYVGRVISRLAFDTAVGRRVARGVSWRLQERFRKPDLYALWRPTATRAALKLFREQRFDAIYATGFPWTSLLIGCDVSKATGCPLIADFRDPWAGEDLFGAERWPRHEQLAQESEVVRHAASVVSVSATMTKRLVAAHPDCDPAKFITIHNGFDPADLVAPAPQPHPRFRIVFTGVWKEGYNPAPLYDVIDWLKRSKPELLKDVEVVAAGFAPGEAARRGLTAHITELGVLSHQDAVSLMNSADVLFLTNGDGARQQLGLPGKMYEYLATGRPVLALTDPHGDAGRIIAQVGGGITVPADDPGALLDAITVVCRNRKLEAPPQNREALSAFERPNLARRLAGVLDDITSDVPVEMDVPRTAPPNPAVLRLRPR